MPEPVTRGDISNSILKRCSESDFGLLHPHLETVGLPVRKTLEARNRRIRTIYFMESGFASVVANGATQPSTEVGLIGREGMSGLAVVLGADRPIHETFMQVAGTGLCLAADSLRRAIDQSSSLHRELLKAAYAFQTQVTHTALANGRSKINERLCRWLLMDRVDATICHGRYAERSGRAANRASSCDDTAARKSPSLVASFAWWIGVLGAVAN